MATLPDRVVELCKRGKLKQPFAVSDVRNHLEGEFAENYIRTALPNYAIETGNYVQRWSEPRFRRVARGRYVLVE